MAETIYDRIHRSLTWQKIIAFNALLFLVTVVPLSIRLAQEDTENRSGAAVEAPAPEVIPPPAYPAQAPKIDRVTEFFGKKGDTVVLLGSNFGNYQWSSKLYVGDVEAGEDNIVRWSDSIIEVAIPEGARTGKVWVDVNSRQAAWEGSLLLYDVARSAQVGIRKDAAGSASIWLTNATGAIRGVMEIAHVSGPLTITSFAGNVTDVNQATDSLGQKTIVRFELPAPLNANLANVLAIQYPGIGGLALIRVEIYDTTGRLIPLYSDPLNVKIN